jgi:hypothetical protein
LRRRRGREGLGKVGCRRSLAGGRRRVQQHTFYPHNEHCRRSSQAGGKRGKFGQPPSDGRCSCSLPSPSYSLDRLSSTVSTHSGQRATASRHSHLHPFLTYTARSASTRTSPSSDTTSLKDRRLLGSTVCTSACVFEAFAGSPLPSQTHTTHLHLLHFQPPLLRPSVPSPRPWSQTCVT